MIVLVSACLLGVPCRYDGGSKPCQGVLGLAKAHHLVPVCPEVYGGLPTPRPSAERVGDKVLSADGQDVTDAFRRGAQEALRLCRLTGCQAAVLKARSPSCGGGMIYDGTFTGALAQGQGVTTALLRAQGIPVVDEEHLDQLYERGESSDRHHHPLL